MQSHTFFSVCVPKLKKKKRKAKQVKQHIDGDLCDVLIRADRAFLSVNKGPEVGSA